MSEALEPSRCPFCNLDGHELVAANAAAVAFFDRYPISSGHTLVVPRRHVASVFELAEGGLPAAARA